MKSPPELWAEVSDAASLARHLGELGEITITRLEPETTVAWEGERASGTVQLAPAGWGTSVTLTAEPVAAPVAEVAPPEPEPIAPEPVAQVAPTLAEPKPPTLAEPKPLTLAEPKPPTLAEPKPPTLAEPKPVAVEPEPVAHAPAEPKPPASEPVRRSWLARLLRRRTTEPEPAHADRAGGAAEDDSATPLAESPRAATGPARSSAEPKPQPIAAEPAPIAAEPTAAEPEPAPVAAEPEPAPVAAEPTPDALLDALTGALDSLGAAHHRPFSRG